ncbi:OadG family protein [Methylomarinum sp. Ch1-1]|uniref:Probable oxaloacetate decarboxylase gamma chain n=1 Tax=Methylomarinum roseum TaxID=3067653 RepID=A0AAU7NUU8_9GAMM|nr:OadG family protein [Methylomarinum sp. Ch1-1]MDP4519132.1 OadG family protein [Methylomarinum sp. Ch1-1]
MNEMMNQGLELMLTGMGIVFVFLAALIVAVNLMSSAIQRFFPSQQLVKSVPPVASGAVDQSVIAAITAAVTQYRRKHH